MIICVMYACGGIQVRKRKHQGFIVFCSRGGQLEKWGIHDVKEREEVSYHVLEE